jgi:hypothetical protein
MEIIVVIGIMLVCGMFCGPSEPGTTLEKLKNRKGM